ncbi:MAG: hypothetical protein ABJP45_15540, partial [Cyclobacteriaceae bacterium]
DYFCFLDSDDMLTTRSISSRIEFFEKNPKISFVDGEVEIIGDNVTGKIWEPVFKGNPYEELILISGSCFFGVTWMIRRKDHIEYKFRPELRNGEDLVFYLDILHQDREVEYDSVNEVVYKRFEVDKSASYNLSGLEHGYKKMLSILKDEHGVPARLLEASKKRVRMILFKSYLSRLHLINAFLILMKKI